jgi:hypothetical protein
MDIRRTSGPIIMRVSISVVPPGIRDVVELEGGVVAVVL